MYGGGGQLDGGNASAASLFSGGGFMPSQATQTPESSNFSRNRSAQTMLPLTVKQISEAMQTNDDKSNFVVDGVDASMVRLLGRVVDKVNRFTDVSFKLDDGTGKVDVNRWVNETSETNEMNAIREGAYVVVSGSLKGFQGKRHVVAFSVRPINHLNAITQHFLECIHVHLENTRPKTQNHQTFQANSTAGTGTPWNVKGNQSSAVSHQIPPYQQFGNGSSTDISSLVMSIFNEPANVAKEHGVQIDDVVRRLKLPADKIRAAIADHVDAGNVYSTIDDNHFKSACNG